MLWKLNSFIVLLFDILTQLERAVRAEGSVETWLTALLQTSQQSIHSIIRSGFTLINDANFNMLAFLDKMPAQVR